MPDPDDERLLHDGTSAAREERAAERAPGGRFLALSVGLHVALAVALLAVGLVPLFCRRDDPPLEPEEFVVAVPPAEEEPEEEPEKPEDEPDEPPPPPDDPDPGPDVVPVTTTTRPRPTTTTTTRPRPTTTTTTRPRPTTTTRDRRAEATLVSRPRNVVTTPTSRAVRPTTTRRPAPPAPSGQRLSPEEVARLINAGAAPGDHTSIPSGEMQRCFAIIDRTIREKWVRPDAGSITGRDPEITISIGPGGVVRSVKLSKSSGNAVFDKSVEDAARAVYKFESLSDEFVRAKPTFTVSFSLREAN